MTMIMIVVMVIIIMIVVVEVEHVVVEVVMVVVKVLPLILMMIIIVHSVQHRLLLVRMAEWIVHTGQFFFSIYYSWPQSLSFSQVGEQLFHIFIYLLVYLFSGTGNTAAVPRKKNSSSRILELC